MTTKPTYKQYLEDIARMSKLTNKSPLQIAQQLFEWYSTKGVDIKDLFEKFNAAER